MRWLNWTEDKLTKLKDANWIMHQGRELLQLLSENKVVIGDESYLFSGHPGRFDRVISMCAWVDFPQQPVVGSKWVSSRADNLQFGLPRGGAVTILNNATTGLPLLAYEGSPISLARTAMVNCLAVSCLFEEPLESVAYIGAGRVHEWQAEYFSQLWPGMKVMVFDLNRERAEEFAERFNGEILEKWEDGLCCDIFSLATAGPMAVGWIPWKQVLDPKQIYAKVWLHTSLRDIQPRLTEKFPLVVVDDHVLATSQGTTHSFAWRENWVKKEISLVDLVVGHYRRDAEEYPVLVSPMGLAMWDVGIGFRLFEDEFLWEQAEQMKFGYEHTAQD